MSTPTTPPAFNRLQRILTVLDGGVPDRVPNLPLISFATARLVGVKANDYYRSAASMSRCLLAGFETYGYDGITVGGDLTVEAEVLGVPVEFPENQAPQVRGTIVDDAADLARLKVPDPRKDGRMPLFLEAIRTVSAATRGEVFIKSTTVSPFVLAGHIMGVEPLMIGTITNRDFVNEVLAFCAEVIRVYTAAQIEAGAHGPGFGAALASPDLLSPGDYVDLVQPHEKPIIDLVHARGARHVMHICGRSMPILARIADGGSDLIDIDHNVDLAEAKAELGPRSALRGNLDVTVDMLRCTPEQILEKARVCIETGRPGGRFILAPGCTVGYATPPENIKALQTSVERYGAY